MPLYKYLPLQYANSLVQSGVVQIGTLLGFRDEEKYGEEIGDKEEGTFTEFSALHGKLKPEEMNEVQKAVVNIGQNSNVTFSNCIAVVKHESPDHYIYSTSKVFSLNLMRTISKDYAEKYDACVKITNPTKFFELISEKIQELAKYEATHPCIYMEKHIYHDKNKPHPALIKAKKYSYQDEFRTLWSPNSEDKISSEILTIPELTSYCELFYVDQGALKEKGLPKIDSKNFESDVVKLDSHHFHDCTFNNSHIMFYAEEAPNLSSCTFNNCSWGFGGAADLTMSFMNTIYHQLQGNGSDLIESTFEKIRKNDWGKVTKNETAV
jgi:hypothetical protein